MKTNLPGDSKGITKYHSDRCWKQWRTDKLVDVLRPSGVMERFSGGFLISISLPATDIECLINRNSEGNSTPSPYRDWLRVLAHKATNDRNKLLKPGYTANATTTTQKQSDYKVEQSSFTLIALF